MTQTFSWTPLLVILTGCIGYYIGYLQYEIKKQEWTKAKWDIYYKNYKKIDNAMSIVMCIRFPTNKAEWKEKSSLYKNLNRKQVIEQEIESAKKLIWEARDEAKLFLEKKLYLFVEKLKKYIDDVYALYDKVDYMFHCSMISGGKISDDALKELSDKTSEITEELIKTDYTKFYRNFTAL